MPDCYIYIPPNTAYKLCDQELVAGKTCIVSLGGNVLPAEKLGYTLIERYVSKHVVGVAEPLLPTV